uniref:DUF5675 domain-containing protein n=1 Tax=Candidatus Kentrum sp. FM TaxID=2126340 RepID=A0A450RV13_9GAMM|nr:MAG: hypothetical protein BECKFM1743A_GA0114220_1000319 [Candidatus Kentron sp. FM]VFJ43658.1 MAG: hypothetical protein BECKFM1743C_GA0114222_1000319 [Candidatus Kentron sp. FM]VFK05654.1 MAG: hypothetical protein BECKFM1743B_GA0114221_1000319 [Candidatus Kentron sp. FM]
MANSVPTIPLRRNCHTNYGTLGELILPSGRRIFTLEPPWQDNQRNISCIYPGLFHVVPDNNGRYRHWRLLDVRGRGNIEFHGGNHYIDPNTRKVQTLGCIVPGLSLDHHHVCSVLGSRAALAVMHRELDRFAESGWDLSIELFDPYRGWGHVQ